MSNNVATLFWKDLRESLRDRRSFMRMLFMPALMIPLMGHFFMEFADSQRQHLDKDVLTYAVVGAQYLPDLVRMYANDPSFKRVDAPTGSLEDAIKKKQLSFALEIPENATQQLKNGQSASIKFYYYQAAPGDSVIKDRGTVPLTQYSERQRDWRLAFLGVVGDTSRSNLMEPLTFSAINVASERERIGHNLGNIIAYPLFIICFVGCAFAAVELAAGEKERGTLEILVMLPMPRYQIVLGKYLVIFAIGLLYSSLSMVSLSSWLSWEGIHASKSFKDVLDEITVVQILVVWLMLVPITALFAAATLAVSVYAKNYREANTLANLVNFIVIVAATAIFVPGVNLTWLWALVPVSNVGMVMRELIKGTLTDRSMLVAIFASSIVITLALLAFSTMWFRREAVINRD
jgi:sodium transport system permease protein